MDVALDVVEGQPGSSNVRLVNAEYKVNKSLLLPPERRSADIRLVARHTDVYEPCDDSYALVDALLADRANLCELHPSICLEVGCGSGYVITSLALMLSDLKDTRFIATDISKSAVETTRLTLEAHNVNADVLVADLVSGIDTHLAGAVDLLVFNPPYVPTPDDEVGIGGIASAWAGGHKGRIVIDCMLEIVDSILSPKGWFYLVTVAANCPGEICQIMRRKGFASRIAIQRSTEEESLHVLKFWRDASNEASDSSNPVSPSGRTSFMQRSLPHHLSRLVSFKPT
ncbi:hypothetical protein KP509_34G070000 [Ceratopteris richardii]|uniref:Methyltransferase small domain-containing protein n=1 Tax=Ceratopteris richardii TaxID=49495 RepID=A0A8T2QMX8_CERRI|nr:hypothetical protein KP509_34G070000 [Ceratopteris richardii]KAH7284772.1 hypothetical protein KP509_34G070000 [Ceratopteris richardii]KAH7284773.1 hypothetical protein KP509_34G070000 [Ceratopteris richardii]